MFCIFIKSYVKIQVFNIIFIQPNMIFVRKTFMSATIVYSVFIILDGKNDEFAYISIRFPFNSY